VLVQQRAVTLIASDGIRLEARAAQPPDARGGIVVCHPHPVYGGSMSTPPVPDLVRAFAARGWAAIRFNFRGTGRSEGRFDEGRGEQRDVLAALAAVRDGLAGDGPLAVAGCSFGALVALAAVAGDASVTRFVAIGPPLGPAAVSARAPIGPAAERLDGWPVRALTVIGGDDPYAPLDAVQAWRDETLGDRMRIEVFEGAPHLLDSHRDALLELVTTFVIA
jgi:alpha/beta superfamily hydrolase